MGSGFRIGAGDMGIGGWSGLITRCCLDRPRCESSVACSRLALGVFGRTGCPWCGTWSACSGGRGALLFLLGGCGALLLGQASGRSGLGAGVGRGSECALLLPTSCWGGRDLGRDDAARTTTTRGSRGGRSGSSSLYPVSESVELQDSLPSWSCPFSKPGVRAGPGAQRQS